MKCITFYSYKGGVGRTLATVNIAKKLVDYGFKVCIMDFDLEAPGINYKLKDELEGKTPNKGVVDYIDYFQKHENIPDSLDEYTIPLMDDKLIYFPAGNIKSSNYWRVLSDLNWKDFLMGNDKMGTYLLLDLKGRIEKQLNVDYLLIDSRTGVTDIAAITMKLLADKVVLLGANNDENVDGLKLILKNLKAVSEGKELEVHTVLTRIPRPKITIEKERAEEKLISFQHALEFDNYSIVKSKNIIYSERELGWGENDFHNLDISKREQFIEDNSKFFSDLFENDLDVLQRDKLKKEYNIQLLQDQLISEFDLIKLKNIYTKLLELDHKAIWFYELAQVYMVDLDFTKVLKNIEKAIDLDSHNSSYYLLKAEVLKKLEKFSDSKIAVEKAGELNDFWRFENLDKYNKHQNYITILKAELYALWGDEENFLINIDLLLQRGVKVWSVINDSVVTSYKNNPKFINLIRQYYPTYSPT